LVACMRVAQKGRVRLTAGGGLMQILLAFAPFIVFAILDRLAGPLAGLLAGAAVALIVLGRDWLIKKQSIKVLDIGTAVLFSGLSLYFLMAKPAWSIIGVRLCVDIGLLLIVLISLAIGKPFTLQYAREQVAREFWDSPEFRKTNFVISGVWALAFAVMVLAELAVLLSPQVPQRLGVIVIVLALVGAVKFTGWYPERAKA
jgi:hypothetical protein